MTVSVKETSTAFTSPSYTPVSATGSTRITSLDIVRGVVMILMAIDHVRVYSGQPAGGPTAGIFFTRWITHFVAPSFAFLAGTGAFFLGRKLGDKQALAVYLVKRGIVLVLLELTVIRLCWTFNVDFANYNLAGVIWMLGWCMVLLAGLVRFSSKTIAIVGLVTIFAQQLIAVPMLVAPAAMKSALGWLWSILYFGGEFHLGPGGLPVLVLFVIVPWVGVMAAGYAFGEIMLLDADRRRKLCYRIGLGATALFAVVAGAIVALRPAGPEAWPALFRFLGQQKYPASQLFLLMTLGPMIALLPLAERARGPISRVLAVFGRVPMFYYLLHIPAIHIAAIIVSLFREGRVDPWLFGNHPLNPGPQPDGYRWSLPLLYLVFAIVVTVLYFPCRWYANEKARKPGGWRSYI